MKALFFDIDGTLVSLRTKVYSQSTRRAIAQLRARGHLCYVATGRSLIEINEERLLDGIEFDGYLTNNGQIVYDGRQQLLFGQPLDGQDVQEILDWSERGGHACWVVTADQSLINQIDDSVRAALEAIHTRAPRVGDIRAAAQDPVYKIVLVQPRAELERLMQRAPHSRMAQWFPLGHDIISRQGGKCWAMEQILLQRGLRRDDSLAFGDGENDMEMLRGAGVGVAMGNAAQAVKDIADYVAPDTDDDGIEYTLRQFHLI